MLLEVAHETALKKIKVLTAEVEAKARVMLKLTVQNTRLAAEVERLTELLTRAGMREVLTQNISLRIAFAKYGVHARDCKYWRYRKPDQCTCGFKQALEGKEKPELPYSEGANDFLANGFCG